MTTAPYEGCRYRTREPRQRAGLLRQRAQQVLQSRVPRSLTMPRCRLRLAGTRGKEEQVVESQRVVICVVRSYAILLREPVKKRATTRLSGSGTTPICTEARVPLSPAHRAHIRFRQMIAPAVRR